MERKRSGMESRADEENRTLSPAELKVFQRAYEAAVRAQSRRRERGPLPPAVRAAREGRELFLRSVQDELLSHV